MQYELKGGSFPIVVCKLAGGEQMITERGSMVWMSPKNSCPVRTKVFTRNDRNAHNHQAQIRYDVYLST